MGIVRYVSQHPDYKFMVLFDGDEFRFSPDATPGGQTPQDQWDAAYAGEVLEGMYAEYERIKAKAPKTKR